MQIIFFFAIACLLRTERYKRDIKSNSEGKKSQIFDFSQNCDTKKLANLTFSQLLFFCNCEFIFHNYEFFLHLLYIPYRLYIPFLTTSHIFDIYCFFTQFFFVVVVILYLAYRTSFLIIVRYKLTHAIYEVKRTTYTFLQLQVYITQLC